MPQTLRTLVLTCLAWFMPLHALDAATGQRISRDGHVWLVDAVEGSVPSANADVESGSADHPVYVQGGDTFQALATLRPGDAVRSLDGLPSTVVAVTPDLGPRTGHNLTVEFAHTYFVDAEVREGWGGVWVLERTPEAGFGWPHQGFRSDRVKMAES